MTQRLRILMVMALLIAAVSLGLPEFAHAQGPGAAGTSPVTKCSDYVGVSNRIVMCVRDSMMNVTDAYFTGFYQLVKKTITAFVTLAVIIYGVMTAFGMIEKISRDTFMLAIKMSIVFFCITNVDWMYDRALTLMDATAKAVIVYTPANGTATGDLAFEQLQCMKNMKDASVDADGYNIPYSPPWLAMDCLVDSIIGIKIPPRLGDTSIPTKGLGMKFYNERLKGPGMARGLLYLFFSSMQTSIVGFILALVGFIFLYSFVFLIVKALFTYLSGYIGIAFMLIFAPLFIPLVLLRKTSEYFNKWLKLTISFALQPVLILVFVSFSIAAVDLAMFSGDYSLMYRIAGEASRQGGSESGTFSLNQYLDENQAILKKPAEIVGVKTTRDAPDQLGPRQVTGVIQTITSGCDPKILTDPAALEKCKSRPIQFWKNSIDWDKLAAIRQPAVEIPEGSTDVTPGKQIAREALAAVVFCAIVVFVMNGLLGVVPLVANDLIGESMASPNLYSSISKRSGNGLDGLVNGVGNSVSGLLGRK